MPYAARKPRMSDTPPDRKEADDALAAPRNPWVSWPVWVVLTPVLYVLSTGPVWWLVAKGILPAEVIQFYAPLTYCGSSFNDLIMRYAGWWLP